MKKQHQRNTTIRKSRDRDNRLIYQQSPKMSNIEQNSSISSSTSSKFTSATSRKENEIFIHRLSVLTKKIRVIIIYYPLQQYHLLLNRFYEIKK